MKFKQTLTGLVLIANTLANSLAFAEEKDKCDFEIDCNTYRIIEFIKEHPDKVKNETQEQLVSPLSSYKLKWNFTRYTKTITINNSPVTLIYTDFSKKEATTGDDIVDIPVKYGKIDREDSLEIEVNDSRLKDINLDGIPEYISPSIEENRRSWYENKYTKLLRAIGRVLCKEKSATKEK